MAFQILNTKIELSDLLLTISKIIMTLVHNSYYTGIIIPLRKDLWLIQLPKYIWNYGVLIEDQSPHNTRHFSRQPQTPCSRSQNQFSNTVILKVLHFNAIWFNQNALLSVETFESCYQSNCQIIQTNQILVQILALNGLLASCSLC